MSAKAELEWFVWRSSFLARCRSPGYKAALAKRLGVSRQVVNHWVNGKMMPGWAVVAIMNDANPLNPLIETNNWNHYR